MTGLLDGLRSWLGSFFGTGDASDDASEDRTSERTAAAPSTVEGTVPTVVHRDDRPLETPADLEPSPPADADRSHPGDGTERDERGRVEIPDAEDGADAGSAPDGVSIPDAESGAETSPESVAGDARPDRADRVAVADAEPPTGTEAAEGGGDAAGVEDADDARTGGVACSVCGTTVDDPDEGCPLCGSTDVRPTSAPADDGPVGSPPRRTVVPVADEDDEAVDRLRDVREDE
ncbi:hypothetical protein ACFR97_03095 [Haloplanus litoreus]|uniref:Zinc ribbon domain-containing protein n=1 Tax=Haloplanus litoreus TaxID=767515 RepID=A0ABD6A080_9EURY